MGAITDRISEYIRDILTGWVLASLESLFGDLNNKVGLITGTVSQSPQAWNPTIFNMVRNVSDTVIVPIAGMAITGVLCYELISVVIDRNNMTNRMRVEVFEGKVRAIMVYPVKRGHKYFGRLIFIENTRERIWSESEKDFAKEMARAVAKLYASGEFEDSPALDNTMLDVFDSMEQDIFIRDNITGKVLYSNKHMNDRLGMDLVDKDSFRMIPKPQDEIPVAEASDKKGRSTKFRRYINELGSIFDVTEISITWKNGEPASVMILTPAVD